MSKTYIASFEMLLVKAGWGCDSHGAILAFKEGLCEPLLKECIRRRPKPVTLTEWMDTARDEEKLYYDLKFELEEAKKRRGGHHLEDLAEDARKGNKRPASDVDPRPYDPMQLDAARTQRRLMDDEQQKLRNKGKCFGCESTKHVYADCPKNPRVRHKGKKRQESPKARTKPRARVADASATIEEVSSEDEEEE
jgi:hypothetical protein